MEENLEGGKEETKEEGEVGMRRSRKMTDRQETDGGEEDATTMEITDTCKRGIVTPNTYVSL